MVVRIIPNNFLFSQDALSFFLSAIFTGLRFLIDGVDFHIHGLCSFFLYFFCIFSIAYLLTPVFNLSVRFLDVEL